MLFPDRSCGVRHSGFHHLQRVALVAILLAGLNPSLIAGDTQRVWVDASGKFSIEATLIEWSQERVRLQRPDGRTVAIEFSQLSDADQDYLLESGRDPEDLHPLRDAVSAAWAPDLLPPFDLPPATDSDAATDATRTLGSVAPVTLDASVAEPNTLPADPAPVAVSIPPAVAAFGKLDSWTTCSRPLLIAMEPAPTVAFSIARGMRLRDGNAGNRVMSLNLATGETSRLWEGEQRISLLDHHAPSGRTLLLENHDSVGHGGELAIASLIPAATESDAVEQPSIEILTRRSIDPGSRIRSVPQVHWARLVDDEHVVALVDGTLRCWNLVSAECLYQIDDIDPRSEPVLSPGRRYLAIPRNGAMWLHSTTDGSPFGRIELDKNLIPGIAFSAGGDKIAITSGRRLRVWDLTAAAIDDDFVASRSLGQGHPVWVSDDWVLSNNGMLLSREKDQAVWRYELVGLDVISLADRVAIFRKHDEAELRILELPHPAALAQITSQPNPGAESAADSRDDAPFGKSRWVDGDWSE